MGPGSDSRGSTMADAQSRFRRVGMAVVALLLGLPGCAEFVRTFGYRDEEGQFAYINDQWLDEHMSHRLASSAAMPSGGGRG